MRWSSAMVGLVWGLAAAAIVLGVGAAIGLANDSCNIDCMAGDTPPWFVWMPLAGAALLIYAAPAMILAGLLVGGTAAVVRRSDEKRQSFLDELESDSMRRRVVLGGGPSTEASEETWRAFASTEDGRSSGRARDGRRWPES
jgi:hypothetical protein